LGLPYAEQDIVCNGATRKNKEELKDFYREGDILHLTRIPVGLLESVCVRGVHNEGAGIGYMSGLPSPATIKHVKEGIAQHWRIPVAEQTILFQNVVCQDTDLISALAERDASGQGYFTLVRVPQTEGIYVRGLNDRDARVVVLIHLLSPARVRTLKEKIAHIYQIPVEEQTMMYDGMVRGDADLISTFSKDRSMTLIRERWFKNPPMVPLKPPELPVGEDVPSEVETDACAICLENKKCCVVMDCMHLCLCIGCARELKQPSCPLCRVKYTSIKRVY
jgi:hypothetical protein